MGVVHITHTISSSGKLLEHGPPQFFEKWTGPYNTEWSILPKICTKRTIFGIWTGPFLTRICASLGSRMKFKTLCYPVFGRNKNTVLPSFWFPIILIAFNAYTICPWNNYWPLGVSLSWVCQVVIMWLLDPRASAPRSWIWVPLGPQRLQMFFICLWLCSCGT